MQNEAAWLVHEFLTRRTLATLGFRDDLASIPEWKAEAFCLIAAAIDDEQERKAKENAKKRSRTGSKR